MPSLKLLLKRSESSEMDSTKTDSPRVSAFVETATRLNAVKISTDPQRI